MYHLLEYWPRRSLTTRFMNCRRRSHVAGGNEGSVSPVCSYALAPSTLLTALLVYSFPHLTAANSLPPLLSPSHFSSHILFRAPFLHAFTHTLLVTHTTSSAVPPPPSPTPSSSHNTGDEQSRCTSVSQITLISRPRSAVWICFVALASCLCYSS